MNVVNHLRESPLGNPAYGGRMPWPDFAQIRVDRDAERAHPKGAAWVQEDVRQERARMEGILQLAIDDRYGDVPFPRQLRHFLNRLSIPLMADHRKEHDEKLWPFYARRQAREEWIAGGAAGAPYAWPAAPVQSFMEGT